MQLLQTLTPFLALAAFLGVGLLSVLVFSQARELKRLRTWAGQAPERADQQRKLRQSR